MSPTRFDPYAILRELQEGRVYFVVIGALARVIQGSDELTRGLDLTPSLRPQNLEKLQQALENLNARRTDGKRLDVRVLDPEREPVIELESDAGEIKIVPHPTGTRGQDDLRHRARRESLGEGLRPEVAERRRPRPHARSPWRDRPDHDGNHAPRRRTRPRTRD